MLGGLDPVIIFQFSALAPSFASVFSSVPILAKIPTLIDQPPIPIYLSETIFNIVIDGESKSVDIDTTTETMSDGSDPQINQKGIQSSVEINIEGKRDSVALTLLSAMVDNVFDKVTSKEYSITYLHGATTIFRAVLHTFSVEAVPGTDKLSVKIGLSRGQKNPIKVSPIPSVPGFTGTLPGT